MAGNLHRTLLAPGNSVTSEGNGPVGLFFFWPGTRDVSPGTDALVLPIWRTNTEDPGAPPTEVVVALVTIVAAPLGSDLSCQQDLGHTSS